MNVRLVFKFIVEAPVREPRMLFFLSVIIFQLAALLTSPQNCRIMCERSQHGIVSNRRSVNAKNAEIQSQQHSTSYVWKRASESLQAVMSNNKTVSSPITTLACLGVHVNQGGRYAGRWQQILLIVNEFWQSCRQLEGSSADWENTTPSFSLMEL